MNVLQQASKIKCHFHPYLEVNIQHCNGLNHVSLGFWSITWLGNPGKNFFKRWPARPGVEFSIFRKTFNIPFNPFKINVK